MLTLPETIDIVAAALALNRGIIAPAEVIRHGPLWIMRDANPKPGKARREEIFAFGAQPAEVVRALNDYGPRGRYVLEPFMAPGEDVDAIKAEYKALGFRMAGSEPLFVCPLASRTPPTGAWPVRRAASLEEARQVSLGIYGKATRNVRPEDFTTEPPATRLYWVEVEGEVVAVARSLLPRPTATWMHDVLTITDYRRRGIATALLSHVLDDDARLGAEQSVLLASHAGSKLYPRLGYQQRALLQIYNPVRAR